MKKKLWLIVIFCFLSILVGCKTSDVDANEVVMEHSDSQLEEIYTQYPEQEWVVKEVRWIVLTYEKQGPETTDTSSRAKYGVLYFIYLENETQTTNLFVRRSIDVWTDGTSYHSQILTLDTYDEYVELYDTTKQSAEEYIQQYGGSSRNSGIKLGVFSGSCTEEEINLMNSKNQATNE